MTNILGDDRRQQILALGRLGWPFRRIYKPAGFPAGSARWRALGSTRRGQRPPEAPPGIVTAAGEEGQVDYGGGPMGRHPPPRKYRRTRLFVCPLGYSRKRVRLLTFISSTRR